MRQVQALVVRMREVLFDSKGYGLSAIQLGIPIHVFVVHVPKETRAPPVFVNPQVSRYSDETVDLCEGCCSFGDVCHLIRRPARVRLKRMTEFGRVDEAKYSGLTARAVLHELNHVSGRLLTDHLEPGAAKTLVEDRLRRRGLT
jgi:peptide deformylase